ncbi:MAG: hypothetical protein ACOX3X_00675 [Eubacteriales bacterium]|jgi:ABC-type glycerol-3-phosphate transport system substrate-binding protein
MLKKVLALALTFTFLLTLFACNGSSEESSAPSYEDETTYESTPESSEEVSEYTPELRDLGEREIRFLVAGSGYSYYESFEIYAEELLNETINDAVYERNRTVEAKYNCRITADKSNNVANDLRTYVSSGLDMYDVYMPMINDAVKLIGEDLMLDLKELESLNLDGEWWDQKAREGLEINNKLYFATGDISILDNDCTMVMFFNKKLVRNYNLGDLYQMVLDHEWTLDKAYELSKGFSQHLEDDSVWDNHDQYGLHVAFNAPHSFYFGCGGTIAEKEPDGSLKITINNERNQDILKDVFEIAFKPDVLTNKLPGCQTFENICEMFLNEQVMFTTFALIDIKEFRNAQDFDFGILPYPLYNSNQDEYRCLVSTGLVPCITIPVTCDNPEDVALAVEALAYYSVETLTKAYYEKTLKGRDLVDNESEVMLDIIFASRVYDLGFIYNFGGVGALIEKMNASNSDNFASYYGAIEDLVKTELEETIKKFK